VTAAALSHAPSSTTTHLAPLSSIGRPTYSASASPFREHSPSLPSPPATTTTTRATSAGSTHSHDSPTYPSFSASASATPRVVPSARGTVFIEEPDIEKEQQLLLKLLERKPAGVLASALAEEFVAAYGRRMQLTDSVGSSVLLRDLLWYHPEVCVQPIGQSAFVLHHTKNFTDTNPPGAMRRLQIQLLQLLEEKAGTGVVSSLFPEEYQRRFDQPLKLVDEEGRKVLLSCLIRWYPGVKVSREKGGFRYYYFP
jgi:hypothetical protein